jgi:DNA processing protein
VQTRILRPGDGDYPRQMGELELAAGSWARAAPSLYARGPLPTDPGICIVGSRHPEPEAAALAAAVAEAVVARGWVVWSGGAEGIDRSAHEAAMRAGGTTVAVVAGGLDKPYPPKHADLYATILASGGALLSLQPEGARLESYHFVWRDELMAGLSLAAVLVQARLRSGSLYTARAARRMNRPVYCVTYPPWQEIGIGGSRLVARGRAKALVDVEPMLREIEPLVSAWRLLGPSRQQLALPWCPEPLPLDEVAPLGPDTDAVLATLADAPVRMDAICRVAGLPVQRVSVALLSLMIRGSVREVPPDSWQRVLSSPR